MIYKYTSFLKRFLPAIKMIEDNNGTLITRPQIIAEKFRVHFKNYLKETQRK